MTGDDPLPGRAYGPLFSGVVAVVALVIDPVVAIVFVGKKPTGAYATMTSAPLAVYGAIPL